MRRYGEPAKSQYKSASMVAKIAGAVLAKKAGAGRRELRRPAPAGVLLIQDLEAEAEQYGCGNQRADQRHAIANQLCADSGMNADLVQGVVDTVRGMPHKQGDDSKDEALANEVLGKGQHLRIAHRIGGEQDAQRYGDAGDEYQHRSE